MTSADHPAPAPDPACRGGATPRRPSYLEPARSAIVGHQLDCPTCKRYGAPYCHVYQRLRLQSEQERLGL